MKNRISKLPWTLFSPTIIAHFGPKDLEDLAIQGHVKDQVAGGVDRCHQATLPVDGLVWVTSRTLGHLWVLLKVDSQIDWPPKRRLK